MGFATRLGRVLLLRKRIEQPGEEAAFAFHHRSAITALTAPQSRIEQVPEGVAKHVEGVDDQRQAKSKPERQALAPSPCIDVPPG